MTLKAEERVRVNTMDIVLVEPETTRRWVAMLRCSESAGRDPLKEKKVRGRHHRRVDITFKVF